MKKKFAAAALAGICLLTFFIPFSPLIIILLMIINLGYGGGFSTLPALLDSRFGMENISKIHGLALSAWAIAGITGTIYRRLFSPTATIIIILLLLPQAFFMRLPW